MSNVITHNSLVEVTYKITDNKQIILEQVDTPISYLHGDNSPLFSKVHHAITGKKINDEVVVALSADEAFGPRIPSLTFTDDINNVPEQFRQVGSEISMQSDTGETKKFIVSKIKNKKLTVDGNHPFAGKDIIFTIKVTAIRLATKEEIDYGGIIKPETDVNISN